MDPNRRASDDGWEEVTQGRSLDGLSVQQGRFQASPQVLVRRAPSELHPHSLVLCCGLTGSDDLHFRYGLAVVRE
jgi:hypothetical protein